MPQINFKSTKIKDFKTSSLSHKENETDVEPLRRSEDRLALLEKLNMTIELEPLLATFTNELCRIVPITGLDFEYHHNKFQLKYSKASTCSFDSELLFKDDRIGKLSYFSASPLNSRQRQFIACVEQQLLQPLHNVIRFEQSKLLNMKDFLTNLGSRNYFEATMRHMLATSERDRRPFTLLLIDLDNFKAVNDTHGHLDGDKVLIEFAGLLNQAVRNNDHVFRFGGDEFAIILAHSDNLHPEFVAQRIVKSIRDSHLFSSMAVTASIGCSNWQPEDTNVTLVNRADKALYQVKRQGKNGYTIVD